ncbi:methyltransferase-like protein 27 [Babylonia areolata]|uniref:methyltransferase-like protein 27 n=1 Tax=Babylonia areolata TaxID=304850 RepID=UPI003FD5AC8B
MAASDETKGGETWENLHSYASKGIVPGVTREQVTDFYNQWAIGGYDKMIHDGKDNALEVFQQALQDLFPADSRDKAVVLDVGAGTGRAGQAMLDVGFKVLDGLEPAREMLKVAERKEVYRHTYTCYLTGQPSHIPADTYDCVTVAGVMAHGGLPCAAFEEMCRIVKPGGYIVNIMRRAFLQEVPDYAHNWGPQRERLEREGRWRVVRMEPYPNHFMGHEGLLMVLQVLQ